MYRYNVICLGYKNPNVEKIKELLQFELSYLLREYPKNRNIIIHPAICIKESNMYNTNVLREYENKKYIEYNLSFSDLDTKPDETRRYNYKICV